MYWKAKVRVLQLWANFKLFQFGNPYVAPVIAAIGPLLGVAWSFGLGLGLAWLFASFISDNPNYLWQFIFLLSFYESVVRGVQNGKWIAGTDEESWLRASTPLTTRRYLLFLWTDEEIWQSKIKLFSSLAGLLGIYLIFPVNPGNLLIAVLFLMLLGNLIALALTLVNYYVIRKSSRLKGRGMLYHMLIPAGAGLFVFLLVRFAMDWAVRFPLTSFTFERYLTWLTSIKEPIFSFGSSLLWIFQQPFLPFTMLAEFLLEGTFETLVFYSLYLCAFLLLNSMLVRMIERKDHTVTVRSQRVDRGILHFFVWLQHVIRRLTRSTVSEVRFRLFLSTLLQNNLTRRSLAVLFGGTLWVYSAFFIAVSLFLPPALQSTGNSVLAVLVAILYPLHMLWSTFQSLKIKLSFDSEGPFLGTLFSNGLSPKEHVRMKSETLRVIAFPGYVLAMTVTLCLLVIPLQVAILLWLLSLAIFLLLAPVVITPSLLVPHYEFFNKQQIGHYPDQRKMSELVRSFLLLALVPSIPIMLLITGEISAVLFFILSLGWVLAGLTVVVVVFRTMMAKRFRTFRLEEISRSRKRQVDRNFWRASIPIAIATACIYLTTIVLTISGQLVLASALFVLPMATIRYILITSFQQTTEHLSTGGHDAASTQRNEAI